MIPEYLLAKIEKSDVIYRCIGNEMKNGILACGFMRKETADRSQYHFSNEYGYHAHRVNLQRDPIEAACDMLSQNLDEEISLEELARSLQIGYETFRKIFKKQTGVSPARYRTRKKMEQARILLEGGVPMKEIAGLVGYGDVYAFSKQFSRFFGFPPGKYRARLHTDAPDLEQF